MKNIITPEIEKLGAVFADNNFALRIVGGTVRDSLLGIIPKDIDFCSDATPEEMIDFLEAAGWKTLPTGIDHGTISVLGELDEPYEITTLRIDTETDGRHAKVDFTKDFKLDAERRDLTINAMSMDLDGNVFDYFNGKEDLANGVAKFVGDANARIKEDYLRILRFFRFQGRFENMQFDDETLIAIKENKDGLDNISGERIWSEMQKILLSKDLSTLLDVMKDTGVCAKLGITNNSVCISSNPITILASVLNMSPIEIVNDWKLSNKEKVLLYFLMENVNQNTTIADAKKFLTCTNTTKEMVVELFKLENRVNDAELINSWSIPTFPIMGKDLLDLGFSPGPKMGEILNTLKMKWVESDFTLNKTALLEVL